MLLGALLGAGVPLDAAAGRRRRRLARAGRRCGPSRSTAAVWLATRCHVEVADSHHAPHLARRTRPARGRRAGRAGAGGRAGRLRPARRRRGRRPRPRRRRRPPSTRSAPSTRSPTWSGSARGSPTCATGSAARSWSAPSRSARGGSAPPTGRCRCRCRRSSSCCAASRRTPARPGAAPAEMCTPTGAALLARWPTRGARSRPWSLEDVGVGAGRARPGDARQRACGCWPVPAVDAGTTRPAATDEELVLEANVDDLDPRLWPGVLEALMAAGRRRRLADPDPDEEGPPRPHAVGAGAPRARRGGAGGGLPRDLHDRPARARR